MSRDGSITEAVRHDATKTRQTSSRAKRIAVDKPPRADPRDACGLKWQFSCGGWPFVIRLLRWAQRRSQH